MTIEVRFRGLEHAGPVADYARHRIHQHLSRFGRVIRGVMVRFSDLNGPRGGKDKRCHVTAQGPSMGTVHLVETHEDLYAGVDRALARLDQTIGRTLERSRTHHDRRHARRTS